MSRTPLPPPSCNVYTPLCLANAMVQALGDFSGAKWLEPCVGTGAFLESLAANGVTRHRIMGIDLAASSEPADHLAVVQRSTEFLNWASCTRKRFDRIVANPPFISLSDLPAEIQRAARRHSCPDGKQIPLGSNCWHAFLCACLKLLKPNGSLAFVLPAAFDYANYGASVRDKLPRMFGRLEVYRCQRPLFETVEDGAVVVVAKDRGVASHRTSRTEHDNLDDLVHCIHSSQTNQIVAGKPLESHAVQTVPLCDVMSIGIGAVTGDARYFLMNEETRIRHDLPVIAMHRVVSRARHIFSPAISRDAWEQLRADGERVWLFRPHGHALEHRAVKQYLMREVPQGGCRKDGFKIRNRKPWYLTPMPARPHGFLSGMCQLGPAICFNRMTSLSTTNTLYTVRFVRGIPRAARIGWATMLLTSSVRRQMGQISRKYPLGLTKFEPGDLQRLLLPLPNLARASLSTYQKAFAALASGDMEACQEMADSCISVS